MIKPQLKTTPKSTPEGTSYLLWQREFETKLLTAIIADTVWLSDFQDQSPTTLPKLFDSKPKTFDYAVIWTYYCDWHSNTNLQYLSDYELKQWTAEVFKLGLTLKDGTHIPAVKFLLNKKRWHDNFRVRHESNRARRFRMFAGVGKLGTLFAI